MPIYELCCPDGHRFEVIQPYSAALPACTACGAPVRKIPAAAGLLSGRVPLPDPARMPQTWRGTRNGNREYVTQLRRVAEQRAGLEARHPELAGDRRPVLAHEGRHEARPLRQGDPPPPGTGHQHSHHGHQHGGHLGSSLPHGGPDSSD